MKKILDFLESVIKMALTILLLGIIAVLVINAIYPLGYRDVIEQNAELYDVDPYLVMAVINTESGFDKNALSHKGARGLMQVLPDTSIWIAEQIGLPYQDADELCTPVNNIRIGTWYLAYLSDKYENVNQVLAAYNAGEGHVDQWLEEGIEIDDKHYEEIPFSETVHYIRKINSQRKTYRTLDDLYKRESKIFTYGIETSHMIKQTIKDKVGKND